MFGFGTYNYDQFRREHLVKDLAKSKFGNAPEPGDDAPDFTLRTLEGDKITLSDFEGEKNVVLTFGSATCPQTAASTSGLNKLHEEFNDRDVEFVFVYVREAHPGEFLAAHASREDKVEAAELLREEESIEFPVVVDELNGKVHKKYGSLPNPTFLIDKSGRVAFRSLGSRAHNLADALEELLERQAERGTEHAIVCGGEDTGLPPMRIFLHAHRALERGGNDALDNFREQMGMPGRMALMGGRVARPVLEHPGAIATGVVAAAGVVALGVWVGKELRRRRFDQTPYHLHDRHQRTWDRNTGTNPDEYEAVGI